MPVTSSLLQSPDKRVISFSLNFRVIRLQVVDAVEEDGIDLFGFDEFVDLDHPAAFRGGLFEFLRIDDDILPVLHFKPFGLFFRRHRLLFIRTDHLLAQSHLVALVKEVKLNPLFFDRGMQLYGHVRIPKMDGSFPDC